MAITREVITLAKLPGDNFILILSDVALALTAYAVSFTAAVNGGYVVWSAALGVIDLGTSGCGTFTMAAEKRWVAFAYSAFVDTISTAFFRVYFVGLIN